MRTPEVVFEKLRVARERLDFEQHIFDAVNARNNAARTLRKFMLNGLDKYPWITQDELEEVTRRCDMTAHELIACRTRVKQARQQVEALEDELAQSSVILNASR